jgi:alkanesulfonate monooxygenase SsuD/methylene tetrahydromethanopterin reductase-like flavin-dependent oxidoreductase (luciferase family)
MLNQKSRPDLGVIFHPKFRPETLADFARRAEAAGFDELWLWDDCFLPGALTSAALALSATRRLKVGIGLLPATAYNPMFAAMEITTLACAFPGRIFPAFGHGVGPWMAQIGAAPRSSLKALAETITAVRQLLSGELVTLHGEQVNLEAVQMQLTAGYVPPIFLGAMRAKSLQLAGRVADGTLLTAMSSPAYVRWALNQIQAGMAEAGRTQHRVTVYMDVKVSQSGAVARAAARQSLAKRLPWADIHLDSLEITAEAASFVQQYGPEGVAQHMPEAWLDEMVAAGTPEQAAQMILNLAEAGADCVVFQPLDGDPDCLDEYARYLMPLLKPAG